MCKVLRITISYFSCADFREWYYSEFVKGRKMLLNRNSSKMFFRQIWLKVMAFS